MADDAAAGVGNDRWQAQFPADRLGRYYYTVEAWVDRFVSWRRDFGKRVQAGQEVSVELLIGAELVAAASRRARGADAKQLQEWNKFLRQGDRAQERARIQLVLSDELPTWPNATLTARWRDAMRKNWRCG